MCAAEEDVERLGRDLERSLALERERSRRPAGPPPGSRATPARTATGAEADIDIAEAPIPGEETKKEGSKPDLPEQRQTGTTEKILCEMVTERHRLEAERGKRERELVMGAEMQDQPKRRAEHMSEKSFLVPLERRENLPGFGCISGRLRSQIGSNPKVTFINYVSAAFLMGYLPRLAVTRR